MVGMCARGRHNFTGERTHDALSVPRVCEQGTAIHAIATDVSATDGRSAASFFGSRASYLPARLTVDAQQETKRCACPLDTGLIARDEIRVRE